jgi:transposase
MSGKRRKYIRESREQAARLVIGPAVRWLMWRPRSAWVNKCWGIGCAFNGEAVAAADTARVLDADERAELERLRREDAELRLDREFLKRQR